MASDDGPGGFDEGAALRAIVEGTATQTGEGFFNALVDAVSRALETDGAWVTEYLRAERRLRALAFRMRGEWIDGYEYPMAGTPCERVIDSCDLVHYPDNIAELFPDDADLTRYDAVSFSGIPLVAAAGQVLGHLAVLDSRPMSLDPRKQALLRIFAARASAELERLHAEAELRKRQEQLRDLIDGAMDAIVELDAARCVDLANPAAEKIFGCAARELIGRDFAELLDAPGRESLQRAMDELESRPPGARSLWIPGALAARSVDGESFAAEATLSRSDPGPRHTLILRNVNERLAAEARIRSLTHETEYLRQEIRDHVGEIVGESPPLQRMLRDVAQVAPTESTVLILGETGTGKELVARAIHAASERRDKPLVKVNCAAIPAALMESEFFGHERGAFTGATARREGRFALADGGTLFLDEVGELPLELQAKLLRVLQEGEFEPVGSNRTRRVDVRVIAATNRDLDKASQQRRFRVDLYYRLNVFPIQVPPLRERREDVPHLAVAFARRFAQQMGRPEAVPSPEDERRLAAYDWPGNVRELQNVIERALITSRDGRLNLDRALPETSAPEALEERPSTPPEATGPTFYTARELEALERENTIRALEASGWKVAGSSGAAARLGLPASTLASRMKALGIRRRD